MKEFTLQLPVFDFKPLEMSFLQKHVFSQYSPALAKSAKALREVFEMAQMNPSINVELIAALENDQYGEQYAAYFSSDLPESALLVAGVEQTGVADDVPTTYITKDMLLDTFNDFVNTHLSTRLVSQDGSQSIELVSFASKLRGWLTMLDGLSCKIAANIDADSLEPALHMSFEYPEPFGLISVVLYAK
jgi:hypothetical protein